MAPGSSSNAPNQTFVRHNFTGYTDYRFGSLLVTNQTGITGGRDQEDDTSYQYRIHLKLISQSSCNEDALRSQLLRIPGIQDVSFDSKAGTFYCYVYAITPLASASLLETVQTAIQQNVAFPLTGTALNPDLVGISLATIISLKSGATTTDQQTAISHATSAVQNYINNLAIGQPLILNDIADQILNVSSLIVDVGQPGNMLGNVFIWRSRADGSRYSRVLIADYTPVPRDRIGPQNWPICSVSIKNS